MTKINFETVYIDTLLYQFWHLAQIFADFWQLPLQKEINMLYLFTNYLKKMTPEAERFNGWAAMLGFVAAVGAYVTTGQIIPGWF